MKKFKNTLYILLTALVLTACSAPQTGTQTAGVSGNTIETVTAEAGGITTDDEEFPEVVGYDYGNTDTSYINSDNPYTTEAESIISLSDIPGYTGAPYVEINGNIPFFTADEITDVSYESYADFDSLGRCQAAMACLGRDLMPTESRESISSVKPTGWVQNKYDFVDGGYIYNRCHLIAFELAGENANAKNLITGTRYFNVTGMLPFENMVTDYIKETGSHVMYRVTPIFEGNNLVADGVLMEAWSVEDDGDGICFNIFCYNVQPGIEIDYATGENWLAGEGQDTAVNSADYPASESTTAGTENTGASDVQFYVLNTNSMKFHLPSCSSVQDMNPNNRQDYTGTRDDLIAQGYSPCGSCKP